MVLAVALGQLALRLLRDPNLHTSVWWPLAGAGIAVLARLNPRSWPAALGGISLGYLVSVLEYGYDPGAAIGIFVAANIELLAASAVLRKLFPTGVRLNSPRHAFLFTVSVLAGVSFGAFLYSFSQYLASEGTFGSLWSAYFRTHALGILLVSPLFLVARTGLRDARRERRLNLEWLAQILTLVAISLLVFALDQHLIVPIVCALPLLWGGLRLGPVRSMVSLQALGLITTVCTLRGLGPFGDEAGWQRAWSIQVFLVVLTLMLLFIVLVAQARDAALQASEERAAALAKAEEITGTGSGVLNVLTGEVTWSPGMYRQLGLDPATVAPAAKRFFSAIHPQDQARVVDSISRMSQTGQTREPLEYRLIRPDGSQRLVQGRTEAERNEDGQVVRLHSTIYDITGQRAAELARSKADSELHAILGAITETGIVGTDASTGLVTRFNAGAEKLLGYRAAEVIGTLQSSAFHTERTREAARARGENDDAMQVFLDETASLGAFTEQITALRKDGSEFPAQLSLTPYTGPDGSREYIGVIIDLSEAMQARVDLRESETKFRLAFDGAPLAMAILGLQAADPGVILQVNPAMCAFAQRSEAQLLQTHLIDLMEEPHATRARHNLALLAGGQLDHVSVDRQFRRAGEGELWGRLSTAAVHPADDRPPYLILMIEDITDRRELTERLRHEAAHDPLTGLPNRSQLRERLDRALAAKARIGNVAVLYIDLDGFKAVNDSQGHSAGDELLIQVADRIAACVRSSDVVARLGGDEFAVLCPGVPDQDTALAIGRSIIATLAEEFELSSAYARIGASVGVALSGADEEGSTASALLEAADGAMYRAKRDGKGRVRVSQR
nr:diguanylate cyclase [Kineosporia babensis]